MQNIEIKTPLQDRAEVESRLATMGAQEVWRKRQRDTFFAVSHGWLKLREESGSPAQLIAYRRSTEESGPRASDYELLELSDADAGRKLLGRALDQEVVVAKERTLWMFRHTRIHLDRVEDLGEFLELETVIREQTVDEARRETDHVIDSLGLRPEEFLARPYRDALLD